MPSLVVLAGGQASRLGRPKHSVEVAGETLLARALRRAGSICADRIVVARPGQSLIVDGATVVHDQVPHEGALAALVTGLSASQRDWSLVLACDLPFVNLDLVRHMITQRAGHDVVLPRLDVGDEPLHALYHKRCIPAIRRALIQGERRLSSFCSDVSVRYVMPEAWRLFDPQGLSFFNINTPDELALAQQIVDYERGGQS